MHLPLLRDLSDAEYRAALKHMEVCHWAAGDVVLEQGAQSEALYLLVAGSLQLGRGHMHVGSWFGETGALFGGRMQAAVVALETAVCVVFPQKCLEQLPAHLLTSLRAAHPEGAEGASATSAGLAGPELDEDEIEIRRCVAEISSPSQLELIRELGKGAPLPCYTPLPSTTRAPLGVPHPSSGAFANVYLVTFAPRAAPTFQGKPQFALKILDRGRVETGKQQANVISLTPTPTLTLNLTLTLTLTLGGRAGARGRADAGQVVSVPH